jgi:hypothetical protein
VKESVEPIPPIPVNLVISTQLPEEAKTTLDRELNRNREDTTEKIVAFLTHNGVTNNKLLYFMEKDFYQEILTKLGFVLSRNFDYSKKGGVCRTSDVTIYLGLTFDIFLPILFEMTIFYW